MSSLSPSLVSPVSHVSHVRSHSSAAPPPDVQQRGGDVVSPSRSREVHVLFEELDATVDSAAAGRTLTVKTVFDGIAAELTRLGPTYTRLRDPHGAFAPYATLPELIRPLTHGKTAEDHRARCSLVTALLATHQQRPHRLWSALLLRAFRPMLCKTWKKLVGAEPEERLALLLTSFQEAIGRVSPHRDPHPDRIGMYVRQATRKRVFAKLARERDWEGVTSADADPDLERDPRTRDEPAVVGARARLLAVRSLGHVDLVGTLGHHGALWDLVRRQHPTASKQEQARIYSRLRDRRRRMVARMRGRPAK
jgi:hypothetical protein